MKLSHSTLKENIIRAIHFEKPYFIPMSFVINPSCWNNYPQEALFDLMEEHTFLFPDFIRPKGKYLPEYPLVARKDEPFKDDFGCVWQTTEDGITGTVVQHPLPDWDAFAGFRAPNPDVSNGLQGVDWAELQKEVNRTKSEDTIIDVGLRHGHTFLQLCDIRGYQDLIYDMMDEEPKLKELIDIIEQFNLQVVKRYLSLSPDIMRYPEDLGMQIGPLLPPGYFRTYIKPSYERIIKPASDKGVIIHMHSDGDIRTLIDDILLSGVEVLNLQDLVNGIDWIADRFAGKTCIDLDIDRQLVTPNGTSAQIDALIREAVEKIGSKQGGLMMIYGLYPGIPLSNVKAVMDAMEKYAFFYT